LKRPAVHCAKCGKATREGKPYCVDHVLLHPYAASVAREITRRHAEAEGYADFDPQGTLAGDVVLAVAHIGETSAARLRREVPEFRRSVDAACYLVLLLGPPVTVRRGVARWLLPAVDSVGRR
jgi:hypothetical protein